MVMGDYVPSRGDIVWMNFTPQTGHEQAGHRPALVVSPREYNAVTSQVTNEVIGKVSTLLA